MTGGLRPYVALVGLGLCWGFSIPMTKLAVSTGHHPLGVIAWQSILMVGFLTTLILMRGGRFVLRPGVLSLYLVVALSGTLVPNLFSFHAAAELPAGVMAIVIALVPMFAMPIALVMRVERWQPRRLGGIALGALAVVLLVGPEASLPQAGAAVFVLVALVAPLCYGFEGNYLARNGTRGLDPVQVLWGANVIGLILSVPLALGSGAWIGPLEGFGVPEAAIVGASVAHCVAYVGYVWLVGRAGSVFASQIAYVVTAAGVLWAMILLGERYSGWVWLAFVLILCGLELVRPRDLAQAKAA